MIEEKTFAQLEQLVNALGVDPEIRRFSLKSGDIELVLERTASAGATVPGQVNSTAATAATPAAAVAAAVPAEVPAEIKVSVNENEEAVPSPIIGTYYSSPSPDKPPYVKVGDRVQTGQVLCIVEAMKLMNEIQSPVSGIITRILVENAENVQKKQPLMFISKD